MCKVVKSTEDWKSAWLVRDLSCLTVCTFQNPVWNCSRNLTTTESLINFSVMEVFWLALQSFISYNAFMALNCGINPRAGDMGGIGFYPTSRPLSNFQSMGFFFSLFFFFFFPHCPPRRFLFVSLAVFGLRKN